MISTPEFFVYPNSNLKMAFDRVKNVYKDLRYHNRQELATYPASLVTTLIADYCFAAAAWLKHGLADSDMAEIGDAAWDFVNHPFSRLIITNNVRETLTRPDVLVIGTIRGLNSPSYHPKMLLDEYQPDPEIFEPTMLVTPNMLFKAQTEPERVIAGFASSASYYRDWTEQKPLRTPDALQRAHAARATILLQALRDDETFQLSATDRVLTARFPKGMASLPKSVDF